MPTGQIESNTTFCKFFINFLSKVNQNHFQCEWKSLFEDGAEILDIRYDTVFKAVFTRDTEKSRFALSD